MQSRAIKCSYKRSLYSLNYTENTFYTELASNNINRKYSVDESKGKMNQEDLYKYKTDQKTNEKLSYNSSIDNAKLFFVQSGILGANNFKDSNELIRKTSTIHTDTCLRNQIRKTSLCLRSKAGNERKKSYDDCLVDLQAEIDLMRVTLEQGENKIITLRTEIGKLKRLLQKIMHVEIEDCNNHTRETFIKIENLMPSLCLFCQQRYIIINDH